MEVELWYSRRAVWYRKMETVVRRTAMMDLLTHSVAGGAGISTSSDYPVLSPPCAFKRSQSIGPGAHEPSCPPATDVTRNERPFAMR